MIENDELIFYPNPFKDLIKIKTKENIKYSFQIFDLNGSLVKSGNFINNSANLSSLKSGVYLMTINNSSKAFRIIKK